MIALSQLLHEARSTFTSLKVRYIHPSLYFLCEEAKFEGLDDEQRETLFVKALSSSPEEIKNALEVGGVVLSLIAPSEHAAIPSFLENTPPAHHWIEFLAHSAPAGAPSTRDNLVHFYGYKGGQARSTVLAMLSKALADDGYRVLAIDADIEAPSLHRQYATKIVRLDSTLLGCVQYGLSPAPQSAYLPKSAEGCVDLIACRPADPSFDMDQAVLALNTALNPALLQNGFQRVIQAGGTYDAILVDHRSGLGSSVLPIAGAFPGSVIAFARLDEQSDEADSYFGVLFSLNPKMPGLFVSFSLDPEDTVEKLVVGRVDASILC